MRSKGSESGKRCAHAWSSYVASGVENGQVICGVRDTHILAAAPQVARSFYEPMWRRGLPLSEPFDPSSLFLASSL